jgi:phospholipid/cholesterol/gamma-HCH transport system substrate-binding protein
VRRLVTALVVVSALAGVVLFTGAKSNPLKGREYKIVFDNAFGLVEGGDFRVGGVKAGKTQSFSVEKRKGHAPKAVVDVKITEPGLGDFRKDASCNILPQSLIGEYYVDCQPGTSKDKLPTDGSGTVPVEHTTSTVPADLVNNILRRPYRERFRLILTELGTGLAGRPDDLQDVVRRASPGLRETSRVLRILGNQNRIIENFITDSDTVVGELENNKRDVARWVTESGNAAEISATRREDIARSFHRLPRFLDELRPTMRRLGELADQQTPLLTDLRRAAPDLNTFFARLGPFSEASRPSLRSLGKSSKAGSRAIAKSKPEISVLKALSNDAPPFAKPLRQFLATMDDRKRAIEDDPRAKRAAPPPPDPTAITGSGGFTGMEAILDYFYWQTLSINLLDDVSHQLRLGTQLDEGENGCSPYHNDIPRNAQDQELFKKCNSWLGPNQPGINKPDFTDGGTASTARAREAAAKPASRVGERRKAGQPDAGPVPGQRDISKPQITLPPAVQELLDKLNTGKVKPPTPQDLQRQAPQLDPNQANQLLDFLLR